MQKSSDGGIKMKERTYVDDVDRSVYDIKDEENDAYRIKSGLDASIVEKISNTTYFNPKNKNATNRTLPVIKKTYKLCQKLASPINIGV